MAETGKVLFRLTDDALIVANSGAAFTREGVIAVCHMHLSEKTGKPEDIYGENDLIVGIANSKVNKYRSDSNELKADAGGEDALGKDQNGRFVWELLQNADDAATLSSENVSGGFIGAKGLGFRSVLEISDSPEIYSGEFNFRFSREESRRILADAGIDVGDDIPAFRIPHKCARDGECSRLLKDGGYATVIRLPFVGGKAGRAEEQLNNLDASFLLFCQRLSRIEIGIRGEARILEINRNRVFGFNDGEADFTLTGDEAPQKWRRWSAAWTPERNGGGKRLSAALCLPRGENGEIAADKERPVHVFFSTSPEVRVPGLKALIHASYNLQSNREHLDKEQPHGKEIRAKIGKLAAVILGKIPGKIPPATALRAFGEIRRVPDDEAKTEIARLQNVLASAVADTAFVPTIGGGLVRPKEARLWEHGLGDVLSKTRGEVSAARLLVSSLACNSEARRVLKQLGAESINPPKHAGLLRHCKNDSPEACLAAWKVAGDIARKMSKEDRDAAISALKNAPIWWTDAGTPRPLNGDTPLLLERPDKWPDWLKADAVAPEFRRMIKDDKVSDKKDGGVSRQDALKSAGVWPLGDERSYFTDALLRFCEGKNAEWWDEMGWEVLFWALRWGGKGVKSRPFLVGLKNEENRIGGAIRAPTDKGWLPAIQCYAGKAWDGPESFDEYFQGVKNRGVLTPMETWKLPANAERDEKKWGDFLRGLGVSWTPKIHQVSLEILPDQFGGLANKYKQECLEKIQRRLHSSAWRVAECSSAFIEEFPGSLAGCSPAAVFRAVQSVKQPAEKAETRMEYAYQQGTRPYKNPESFALFQLRQSAWISCRPGLLHPNDLVAPKDAFMPGCGMGILAEIDDGKCPDSEWHGSGGVMEMLKGLGVPEELPNEPERFHKWMSELAQCAEKLPPDAPERRWVSIRPGASDNRGCLANAAKSLFAIHFRKFPDTPIPGEISAPFLRKTAKGEFVHFAPAREIFHADQSHFADRNVRARVLELSTLKVFPLFLNDAHAERAGLPALSEKMNMRVAPPEKRPREETEELRSRYEKCRSLLEKAAESVLGKVAPLRQDLEVFACGKMVMESSDYPDIRPEIDFWLDGEAPATLYVNADGGNSRRWNSLAGGIAKIMGAEAYRADFQNFLQEENPDERFRMLRNDPFGLTEEALQELGLGAVVVGSGPEEDKNGGNSGNKPPTPENGALGGGNSSATPSPGRSRTNGGDPITRKEVESAAVQVVKKYYEGRKYDVVSVEGDNVGWDLNVQRDGETVFRVEVKGIRASRISVGLTPNEYSKSDDDSFRLAIVRNALNGDGVCAVYKKEGRKKWRREEGNDENAPKRLMTDEKTEAIVKQAGN